MEKGKRTADQYPLRYDQKRGKMLQIALFGLLFIMAGVYLMSIGFGPGSDRSILGGIIGILSLLLGLAGLLFGLKQSLNPKPALVLDEKGLYDRTSASGAGFVAWNSISRIEPYTLMNQSFIGIDLYEPAQVLERQGMIARGLMKANRGFVSFPVNLAMQGFGRAAEDILIEIDAHWRQYGEI